MGKFLFFDIDGTLSGKSRVITEKTKQAIQTARNLLYIQSLLI